MKIHSDNPEHGFQFPGEFELSAMGSAEAGLETVLLEELVAVGIQVVHEDVRVKASSGGRYVSVCIRFRARDRAEYDLAHTTLRGHPEVKWTL